MNILVFFAILSIASGQNVPSSCNNEGEIAFTFDQGPSYYTGVLLNILKKHEAKVAFHVTTEYLQNPAIMAYLRSASRDGHIVGLFINENVTLDSVSDYLKNKTSIIERFTGQKVVFLRFALPLPSNDILAKINQLGYIVTTYNLDSKDYSFQTSVPGWNPIYDEFKRQLDQIVEPARGAFIVVQRDLIAPSVNQTDMMIEYAKKKGYRPVRLDQCLGLKSTSIPTDNSPKDNPTGLDPPEAPLTEPKKSSSMKNSSIALALLYIQLLAFMLL